MDKTTKFTEPHKMWILSRKITDFIAVIGSMKEFELPVTPEMCNKLCDLTCELSLFACDFKTFIYGTEDTTSPAD